VAETKSIPQNIRKIADIYLNCDDKCDACLLNTIVTEDGATFCGLVGFLALEFDKVKYSEPSTN